MSQPNNFLSIISRLKHRADNSKNTRVKIFERRKIYSDSHRPLGVDRDVAIKSQGKTGHSIGRLNVPLLDSNARHPANYPVAVFKAKLVRSLYDPIACAIQRSRGEEFGKGT